MRRVDAVFLAALVAGVSYYGERWTDTWPMVAIAWKGLGVGLLALWALARAKSGEGWTIAAILALGALGDVLLEAAGLVAGAVAFVAGHCMAVTLYLRRRRGPIWFVPLAAAAVAAIAWNLPDARGDAPGIALYAAALGAMAGAAAVSRFPATVAAGAALFVLSDLLIFAQMGPLGGSPLPGALIWPTYFAAQVLIAWDVVATVNEEVRHDTRVHDRI